MVEQKICSFCGSNIEPGTGRIFVRKDGLTYTFCGSKCYKNLVVMRRLPRETEWTTAYKREKEVRMAPVTEGSKRAAGKAAAAKKVRKVARIAKATEKAPAEDKKEASAKTEGAKQ
jgi:large subunit ribosomal protein L24e